MIVHSWRCWHLCQSHHHNIAHIYDCDYDTWHKQNHISFYTWTANRSGPLYTIGAHTHMHVECLPSKTQPVNQAVCARFVRKINIIINHKTFLMESIFCPEQDVCFVRIHLVCARGVARRVCVCVYAMIATNNSQTKLAVQ